MIYVNLTGMLTSCLIYNRILGKWHKITTSDFSTDVGKKVKRRRLTAVALSLIMQWTIFLRKLSLKTDSPHF